MAKVLKTAALVVGAAALIATGVGAAAGAGLLGAAAASGGVIAGVATAATFTSIGALAGVGAAVLSFAAAAAAPKGSLAGSATKFTIDKDSGIPVVFGRTYVAGRVLHRQYYGDKNTIESWVTALSLGPVKSVGPLLIDKAAVPFAGMAAQGGYAGFMWLDTQLGACPEARALAGPQGPFPGWGGTSKLSGLAADLWTLKFDTKGKVYPNGVPERGRVIEGMFVYDMRQDSTYPGGNGPCRLGQEDTYVYSTNPALHAVTWAFGRYQNGVLIAGGGLKQTGIDLAPFCEWAGTCELNKWEVGGTVFTTDDDSWDVLKMIAQAGGGEVMPVGALLSCTFSAPRVSIGTITSADISGDITVPSTPSRRTRRNTVIVRVRLEDQGWEVVPLDSIAIPDYVAVDGGSRPTEIQFPLVQGVDQGAQLGIYQLLNQREIDGIVLPCKIYALGYRPGDCLTTNIPEADLVGRDVVVRNREIDGSSMGVTLTCRTETATKHPFALGQGGKAPPTPDLSIPPSYPIGETRAAHVLQPGTQTIAYPVTSTSTAINITAFGGVLDDGTSTAFPAGSITGLAAGTNFVVLWQLSASSYSAVPYPATAQMASADYVWIVNQATLNGDGTAPEQDAPPPGYGGGGGGGVGCPVPSAQVLLANASRDGPGATIAAGELVAGGHWVWAPHEHSGEWNAWPVIRAVRIEDEIWAAHGRPETSASHLWWIDGGWVRMDAIGVDTGRRGTVMSVTVADAHTYTLVGADGDWLVSHNKAATEPTV